MVKVKWDGAEAEYGDWGIMRDSRDTSVKRYEGVIIGVLDRKGATIVVVRGDDLRIHDVPRDLITA